MIEKFKEIKDFAEEFDKKLDSIKLEIEEKQKVQRLHTRFFGYLTKSKNAKEKWN
jgi:hypothetical protein